jgi:hypothetical protein
MGEQHILITTVNIFSKGYWLGCMPLGPILSNLFNVKCLTSGTNLHDQCYIYRWMYRRFQWDRYTWLHNSFFRRRGRIAQTLSSLSSICFAEEWHTTVSPNLSKMHVVFRIHVWAGVNVWINLNHWAWVNNWHASRP